MFHIKLLCCKSIYLAALVFLLILIPVLPVLAQVQLPLPDNFKNLTTNGRTLEKSFDFTVDKSSSQTTQNFILDKTGVILHMQPTPKIKDSNTALKIIDETGAEIQTYLYPGNSLFALLDSSKTYSIIQRIKPDCNSIIANLGLDTEKVICPDTEEFKLYGNIMISSDTSFMIMLQTPTEYYASALTLPDNISRVDKFQLTEIKKVLNPSSSTTSDSINTGEQQNIANLLGIGEICITGETITKKSIETTDCLFNNPNINSIFHFKDEFKNKQIKNNSTNLGFSYIPRIFIKSNFSYFFKDNENFLTENTAKEISILDPLENVNFESYDSSIKFKLGSFDNAKTKTKDNSYKLNSPLNINLVLTKTTFNIPLTNLESTINPFTDQSKSSILSNLAISGNQSMTLNTFNISTDNNIVINDLIETQTENSSKVKSSTALQVTSEGSLITSTYLPSDNYSINITKTYSSVEKDTAPSVDSKGKPIETVNNKSFLQWLLTKKITLTDLTVSSLNIELTPASDLLKDNSLTEQFMLSGFIIPPDFRPVLEDNYRAGIKLFRTFELTNNNSVSVNYSDLKTKDESKLVNFFDFSFIPKGEYFVNIIFDGNRESFLKTANILSAKKQ